MSTRSKPKNYVVYCATNKINDKQYIGRTDCFERRKAEHIRAAKNLNLNEISLLHQAIAKYGVESFVWKIIGKHKSFKTNKKKEKYYILKYNTLAPNGYNIRLEDAANGPGGKKILSDEIVLKVKHETLTSKLSYEKIGKKYGIAFQTVSKIANNKTRSYLLGGTPIVKRTGVEHLNPNYPNIKLPKKRELQKLANSKSISSIAKLYGVSPPTIKKQAIKLGCVLPKRKFTECPDKQLLQSLLKTHILKDIASIIGVFPAQLNKWLKKHNLKKPSYNPTRLPLISKRKLTKLLLQMPVIKIALLLDSTPHIINRWIKFYGCKKLPSRYWSRMHACKGQQNVSSKLTESQVIEIIHSTEPVLVLSKRYKVTTATVSKIRLRRTWKHIKI